MIIKNNFKFFKALQCPRQCRSVFVDISLAFLSIANLAFDYVSFIIKFRKFFILIALLGSDCTSLQHRR